MDERYAEAVPIAMKKNAIKNGGYVPPVTSLSNAVAPDSIIESAYKGSKELNHARELRWHGKTEEAIRLLESYVVQHPDIVVARIELAYCYMKATQPRKARLACIAGLMAHPSEHDKKILWQIIEHCPKG